MRKKMILFLFLCLIGSITQAQETKKQTLPHSLAASTEKLMLSGSCPDDNVTWDFFCTAGRKSGEWTTIRVPSCWELEGFGEYNYGHDRNKASEKGLYRTSFTLPADWKGKRIFIVFEGSMTDTEVRVNGKQAGDIHQGSFYRFKREITHLVSHKSENRLEVEVSKMSSNASVNSAEREADFWIFGGIFRPVYLEAQPNTFVEYTAIDARQDGEIRLEAFLNREVANAEIQVDLFDAQSGKKVGDFQAAYPTKTKQLIASSQIAGVTPWSAEDPHLYHAVITVSQKGKTLHTLRERFGFRTVEVKERDGVYVNGQKIRFKGINRHSHWPTTGRSVSPEQNLNDVKLIKEMNMNAVRMSHYPPDKNFLEVCDSLGLYVIDELCAWQSPPYDTGVGTILLHEMLKRDINHPSIIFWANGNEGGFNFDLDPIFPQLDIQKRPVLHPWALFSGINTIHYITYHSGIRDMFNGREIFMPTELIHGLYDGGHGAGLDDFWNLMLSNPLSAGMFLWDFADQAVVRTDKNGLLDTDKDHGADGIVGPYREKEGSFYTVKEIWSPIFVEKKYITPAWDGTLRIENRYDFTNTRDCSFSYRLARINSLDGEKEEKRGTIDAPAIDPWHKGDLKITLPDDWKRYDVFYLTAKGPKGEELYTWSFELTSPAFFAERILETIPAGASKATATEEDTYYLLSAAGIRVKIDKKSGLLKEVVNGKGLIPLTDGPVYITERDVVCKEVALTTADGLPRIDVVYNYQRGGEAYRFFWVMQDNGVLQLDYGYRPQDDIEMIGITFRFPEEGVSGAKLMANGPYRVYNNRLKGGTLDVWEKEYNDAITGERWIYPEFKGYYSLFYGMKLLCPTPFEVYCASEDISLHLFTPSIQQQYSVERNYTFPNYPEGNLSFMDAIPAVGTKFAKAENFGPQSQNHRFKIYGSPNLKNKIYFKFH
ncbi:glycoside hydrolase family 2 [Parabacteroides sp. OttesenSCG-928-B22]|nr:glycoside hydrolase family 2 [Parabacteroides sp. OttesenSCG-928-B22]